MSLLESLAGMAGQVLKQQQGGTGGNGGLLEAAVAMLNNGSAQGGIEGLVRQLTQAGLGDQIQSWIGTGANLPVTGGDLQQALGHDQLDALARQFGGSGSEIAGQLAQVLPGLVDQLTPNGQIPTGGIDDALSSLSKVLRA